VRSDTVSLRPGGRVEIRTRRGPLHITAWDRPQVAYEVAPAPGRRDAAAARMPEIAQTEDTLLFGSPNAVEWSIHIPGVLSLSPGASRAPAARYRATLPRTTRLRIRGRDAPISVAGLRADARIESQSGTVAVRDVEGRLSLEVHADTARVHALRGGIDLEMHDGTAWIDLAALTVPSQVAAFTGTVHLFLPRAAGFTLADDDPPSALSVDEAFGAPATTNGAAAYNGGGPRLQLDAFAGTITIRPRDAPHIPPR